MFSIFTILLLKHWMFSGPSVCLDGIRRIIFCSCRFPRKGSKKSKQNSPNDLARIRKRGGKWRWVLCILTSQQVLCTQLACWNHVFWSFNILFCHKKNKEKTQEKLEKYMKKLIYQHLGASPKGWQTPKNSSTPGKKMIFLNFVWRN